MWHGCGVDLRNRLIADIARNQHGVFTRSQALSTGIGDRTIGSRTASGVYERLYPEVYAFPGATATWHRAVAAAVFSAMPPAAASHTTAAFLWGLADGAGETIEVVCRRHQRVHRERFRLHESKDLKRFDIVSVDGIPVTSPVRTVVDLGASVPLGTVARCLDSGLRMQLFTLPEVRRFIARVARPGRAGVGTIRPLVEERMSWAGLTESALEDLFRELIVQSPLPMPEPQFELRESTGAFVGRFDFAYQEYLALIELDSERWHMNPESFQRDREKQNRAHAMGWTVYRFTWRQLRQEPSHVLNTLAYITAK